MRRTFSIISLGCFRNTYDSEILIPQFTNQGYVFTPPASLFINNKKKTNTVDLLIVNTCGFIDNAKKESLKVIAEAVDLKKKARVRKIIVLGCLVKRYQKELENSFPLIDEWQGLVEFGRGFTKRGKLSFSSQKSFLKICEGCLNRCSFCAIPLIKGSLRSKFSQEIIKEVRYLDKQGVAELNIIGQDITSWGKDFKPKGDLTELLREVLKVTKNIRWIRLIYTHPKHFTNSLIELIAGEERICKYIDLPIQHINDRILKLMNRGITRKQTIDLVRRIRKGIPDCVIRSSVIVGFPTESEKEFKELLDFLKDIKFERLGGFIYSREEGTQAYRLSPQVHPNTKKRRLNQVMEQQQKIANEANKRFLNKKLNVLIEAKDSDAIIARSQYDAPDVDGAVFLNKKGLKIGDFYRAKIIDCLDYDLVGQ
ncbi:MAG: MiaB/RimO family radical SAM methylthiotransferase [Candidatus Omnitrophota bacterium]